VLKYIVMLLVVMLAGPVTAASGETWTLEHSVQRALEMAPEARIADAEIEARRGEYQQADSWPNPTLDISASDKVGLEEGTGDTDLARVAITQPLPLMRLKHERHVADANINAAEANRRAVLLEIESRSAQAFHELQLTSAQFELARKRVEAAQSYGKRGADGLTRYLTPAESLRLDILRADAEQAVASAEGEWSEALSHFNTLLMLPIETNSTVAAIVQAKPPAPLDMLLANLEDHAAIAAARSEQEAANVAVQAARSRRFIDPALTIYRERDFIRGGREDITGIGINVQIPLWNTNNGGVAASLARADAAEARRAALMLELQARVRQTHTHLGHLIEQAEHFRTKVLEPARKLMEVARKSFAAGETNVLGLIDAHQSYFQAQVHYVELLSEGWSETAELRLATGQSLLEVKP
jgi:outer membrane protein, heavy metal efflux system